MQAPLDPTFLIKLLITVFLLAIFMCLFIYLTRTRGREIPRGGIYNAFNNDGGDLNASWMKIKASRIDTAFNNKKRAKHNIEGTRIISIDEPSQAANSEAYFFGGGNYPANYKGKHI